MVITLNEETQKIFNKKELVIITERVDDVALLIGQMLKMGLNEVLDKHIPKHWKQRGLSWGWTAMIWLAYILTEGDHRKVSVEEYIKGMTNTLSHLTGQEIDPLDFSDDRLSHLLKHLSKKKYWHKIEQDLNERTVEVFDLPQEVIRCDATTVSGYHDVTEEGLLQFGHSKDDPTRPQIKLMIGALDPLGMPLAIDVLSGEKADDGLYIPVISRIQEGLSKNGLLFVGDCKMSALGTRAHVVGSNDFYLSPLPLVGTTARDMEEWITRGIEKDNNGLIELIFKQNDRDEEVLVAGGYEFERPYSYTMQEGQVEWIERVLVVNSPAHAERQVVGLDKRVANALKEIDALTPDRGRGKRQITEEDKLLETIKKVLKEHRVEDLLIIDYEKQIDKKTQYVGRGRGSADRIKRVVEKVRYQITRILRDENKIGEVKKRFGWKAFVTNATQNKLSLQNAILCYRNEYRIERIFNRLKSQLNIGPLFVKKDDQINGLTYLLTLGVRVLTLMEFVLQRSLQQDSAKLSDLHPENKIKMTDKPSAERILKAFSGVSLTIIKDVIGNEIMRWIVPLSAMQQEIVQRLGLNPILYQQLEI